MDLLEKAAAGISGMTLEEMAGESIIAAVRDLAIKWQHSIGEQDLSWGEVIQWMDAFTALAKAADPSGELLEELKENGIA